MSRARKQVMWTGLGLATLFLAGLVSLGGGGAALALEEAPTLDVSRAPDGALLIRDATVGGTDSKVTVVRDGETGGLLVSEPTCTLRSRIGRIREDGSLYIAEHAGALRVELGAGDDTLIADLKRGAFGRGIEYAGGDGFDTVEVRADGDVAHAARNAHDGTIEAAGTCIQYRELEPLIFVGSGPGSTLFVDFFTGQGSLVALIDDAVPGDGVSLLTGTGVEDILWSNFGSLVVSGGPDDNIFAFFDIDSASNLAQLQINGEAGDDYLSLSVNAGIPTWLATAAFEFHGGANTAVGDALFIGGVVSHTAVTFTATNANDGTIDVDGATITYTGLEPIEDQTTAVTKTFIFSGASETIDLSSGTTVGDGLNFINSTAGESVTFTPPTTTLLVDCGGGGDSVVVTSPLEGGPPVPYLVEVLGQAGTDSLVYRAFCAATISPATSTSGVITQPGVMTVRYASFESVATIPAAAVSCSVARPLLWPPRGGLLPVGFTPVPGGACDSTVTATVYSNEGVGGFSPDATSAGGLRLRAERNYPGSGRVYLVVAQVAGQAVDCCTVVVPALPFGSSILGVRADATAAESFCLANGGAAPAGYTQVLQYTVAVP